MNTTESREFAVHLADLLRNERFAMADFLVALAEYDRKRGWLELGYSNLYDFLARDLRMSKGTAFYRQIAVELIQAYPEVVDALRRGDLCITALHALSKAITPENRAEVLPRFFHRSKQEARQLAAELAPAPVVPRRELVTVVRAPAQPQPSLGLALTPAQDRVAASQPVGKPSTAITPPERSALRADPLTAAETRVHLTVSPAFLKKLEAARLALSHSMPGATTEDVLTAGLDLILAKDAKRKAQLKDRVRARPANEAHLSSDTIPAAVRREVWKRDQGRCQYPLDGGDICGSELRTELDHIHPESLGGKPTVENLRVTCEFHNQLAAREKLGDALMDAYTRNPRLPGVGAPRAPSP